LKNNDLYRTLAGLLLAGFFLLADQTGLGTYLAITALLHECAHLFAMHLCCAKVRLFQFSLTGANIRYSAPLSYRQDLIIASAGPFANFFLAVLCASIAPHCLYVKTLHIFAGTNLVIGLFNLLPADPMDGGRILFSFLASTLEFQTALRISRIFNILTGAILTLFGLYIWLKTRYNITMLIIGIYLLTGGTYESQTNSAPG